tara:strand:+ start:363 stop:602 length:240 start_codon:yes stop_codon:yes gene_type:complete
MKTITINIDDKIEKDFRETVKEDRGIGKGKIGAAVSEALQLWIKEKKEEEIAAQQIDIMKKAKSLGKFKFNREKIKGHF